MHSQRSCDAFEKNSSCRQGSSKQTIHPSEDAQLSEMFVLETDRTGDVIRIRSLHVSRPTLFFEVEVLASQVKPDLSSYGYVLPRQAHCETAQLHCRRLIARPHLSTIPYLLFVSVAAIHHAKCLDTIVNGYAGTDRS